MSMFEEDREIVNILLSEDVQFRRLYEKYGELKHDVSAAQKKGHLSVEEDTLETMKKQKVLMKDKLARMFADYRHHNAGPP